MGKRHTKKSAKPKVHKVVLPPDTVLHVVVPEPLVPLIAHDPVKGIVQIVPVKKKSWLERVFGA